MYVHGNNLARKEAQKSKYKGKKSRELLAKIREEYDKWKELNEKLDGPFAKRSRTDNETIKKRVKQLNDYKNFLDQKVYAEEIDSRSNLHSSVLEEFVYYLFRDLVANISKTALIGKSKSFKDVFFRSPSYRAMLKRPNVLVETKALDFAIGVRVNASIKSSGADEDEIHDWDIPAVAIECKTYLDKTMLQDASTAAEQLKQKNPNAIYIVVAEWLKLTESVNLEKYKIDQIYVLRKQKNTDRELRYDSKYKKNPIYPDVVAHCFNTVRKHLTTDWERGIADGLKKGVLKK